jgi:hypothetical protein
MNSLYNTARKYASMQIQTASNSRVICMLHEKGERDKKGIKEREKGKEKRKKRLKRRRVRKKKDNNRKKITERERNK